MTKNSPNTASHLRDFFHILLPGLSVLFLLIAWEATVHFFQIEKWILPKPSMVAGAVWNSREILLENTSQTLLEALLGFGLAFVVGTAKSIDVSSAFTNQFLPKDGK